MHHMHGLLVNHFLTNQKIENTQLCRKLNKVITSLHLRVISKTLYREEGRMRKEGSVKFLKYISYTT